MRFLSVLIALAAVGGCAAGNAADRAEREFRRGLALHKQSRYDEAAKAFEKTVELDADHGEASLYLGRSHVRRGRWREALPPLRAAYLHSPPYARQEAEELILDLLIRHASELDPVTKMKFEELIRGD